MSDDLVLEGMAWMLWGLRENFQFRVGEYQLWRIKWKPIDLAKVRDYAIKNKII